MGTSYLGFKSVKQRVGSPSSTDAEIIAAVDGLKNLKWLDSHTFKIGLNLQTCDLYQDNRSASKFIKRPTKTKQLKHQSSQINLAQVYYADKLFELILTPTYKIIADSLTKIKSAHNYTTVETTRLGEYKVYKKLF